MKKNGLGWIVHLVRQRLKGAWSEIFVKLIFFKLADMATTFATNIIIHGEKVANMYLICKQFEKTMFMLLIVL